MYSAVPGRRGNVEIGNHLGEKRKIQSQTAISLTLSPGSVRIMWGQEGVNVNNLG